MAQLLNLVGLSAGVALYTMLLVMVMRGSRAPGAHRRWDPLLLVTSVLGLVWNLAALPVYELPRMAFNGPFPFLTAIGLGALGFLPAVVVHSVLRGGHEAIHGAVKRTVALIAYGASSVAMLLHLVSAAGGRPVPSSPAMRLLTYTFVALMPLVAAVTRKQAGSRRALWVSALSIFAVSGLHLSQLHGGELSWPVELLGHHASLPLAFAILYQDYPFALADLFLKRALALLAIVAFAFAGIVAFSSQSEAFERFTRTDPSLVGLLVTLCVVSALVYPAVRRATAWFADRIVLHRPDYRLLRADIMRRVQTHHDLPALLSEVCNLLGPAMCASTVTWRERQSMDADESLGTVYVRDQRATVLVPTADPPRFVIQVEGLTGGRRFLSDDVGTLDAIAIAVARRIDAIRITRERYEQALREQEMGKLASEAELRALRAQVNPHFLFNALTTIGYLIQTAPPRALETLMRLTSLLRAVLRSEGEFTTLGRELELVESYLDIERERFEHRLRVTIEVPAGLRAIRVPALIIQPLVENAVKHGISAKRLGGALAVRAAVDGRAVEDRHLSITVEDTGAGASGAALARGRESGVGLKNVERRLQCHYGDAGSLSIQSIPNVGTTVQIRLPVPTRVTEVHDPAQVAL
jgi:signal transduction histidine kinase